MTTDKLPDVVWIHHHFRWTYEDDEGDVLDGSTAYVRKSALDAMTAERDSAREALAKACEVVREYLECDRLMQMDGCPDDRFSPALTALRALAAQPETKL